MPRDRTALLGLLDPSGAHARRAGDEHYFRTGEVATILRVSSRAVRSWADDGKLECVRTTGGHRLFPAATVRAALDRMESRGDA